MSDKPKLAQVKTLYESNILDIPACLRTIAKEIEDGLFGDVTHSALVLYAPDESMQMFGHGRDVTAEAAALLLISGGNALARRRFGD